MISRTARITATIQTIRETCGSLGRGKVSRGSVSRGAVQLGVWSEGRATAGILSLGRVKARDRRVRCRLEPSSGRVRDAAIA
jgi:hypothetical protein